MAQISYNQAVENQNSGSSYENNSNVGFFRLTNDGEEAIVRFPYESKEQFEIFNVHSVATSSNKYPIHVNCLRSGNEPIENCPFCAAGKKFPLSQRAFVRIIQYTIGSDGSVIAEPKIWERPVAFFTDVWQVISNYGPHTLCKVIRNGAAGSKDTKYSILGGLPSSIYRDDLYPYTPDLFGDYSPLGHALRNKSADAMNTFLATGEFPQYVPKEQQNSAPAQAYTPTQAYAPTPTPAYAPQPTYQTQGAYQPQANVVTPPNIPQQNVVVPPAIQPQPAVMPQNQPVTPTPVQPVNVPNAPQQPAVNQNPQPVVVNTVPWESNGASQPAQTPELTRPTRNYF